MSETDKTQNCSCSDNADRNHATGDRSGNSGKSRSTSRATDGYSSGNYKDYTSGDSAGTSSGHQFGKAGSGRGKQGDRINFGDGMDHGDKF